MSGRRVSVLCVFLFASALAGAQQPGLSTSTVDELVRTGIAQNKELLSLRERVAEARGLVQQAGVRSAPTLGLRGATGRPLGTYGEEQYGAEYSQPLETFGKRAKRIQVASFDVGQAEAELQERSAELAYEIRAGVAEQQAELGKLKLLDDLEKVNQDALRLTETRVREGDVAPLEANLLRVEINRAHVLRVSAQGRLASDELNLRKLIGLRPDQMPPRIASGVPVADTLEALKAKALQARADLRVTELQEEQSRAGVELAKANAKPDVDLSAGYMRQYNQFDGIFGQSATGAVVPLRDRDDVLSFGVTIPLRTTRSGRGNIQAAAARSSEAQLRREYLERSIPLEVETAYQRWSAAKSSLELLHSGVLDPSIANLDVIREAYKLGQLRLLDVLNQQRQLVDTELAYIDAQADAARTWAEVERAIGGNLP